MSDQSLFKVDSITQDGQAIPFGDGTARVNGLAGYTATAVPAGSGPDFESYAREPRSIDFEWLMGPKQSPDDIKKIKGARVVLKDMNGPRRIIAHNCSFASMGSVGAGSIPVKLNVLEPYQIL